MGEQPGPGGSHGQYPSVSALLTVFSTNSQVWSIEADDFRGDYGAKYPLISTIKRIMNSGDSLDPDLVLGEDDFCETANSCWTLY